MEVPSTRGNSVIVQPSIEHLSQPSSGLVHISVHPLEQFQFHPLKEARHPFGNRFAPKTKLSVPGLTAVVRKPKKVKGLRSAQTLPPASLLCKTPEFQQACFARMQSESKELKPILKVTQEAFCLPLVLEAHHEIVRVADDVCLPYRRP